MNTSSSKLSLTVLTILVLTACSGSGAENTGSTWPQFRGPNCSGVGLSGNPPVDLSPSNKVVWTIDVPWSPSSPVIWNDRIYLTTFVEGRLETQAYHRPDGKILWSKGIKAAELETFHNSDGSPAASTPATDGRRVVSYFGSLGLVCYNLEGQELWRYPLPVARSYGGFGTGTSPLIAGRLVVLNRDQTEKSSLLAIDLESGEKVWETARPEAYGSFGTPIIWQNDHTTEIIVPGSLTLKGYELKTGQERWKIDGLATFACTTPVFGDGLLFFAAWSPGKADSPWPAWKSILADHDKNKDGAITFDEFEESDRDFARGMDADKDNKVTQADYDIIASRIAKGENLLVAVKPGGRGDIAKTHVAWKFTRGLPYVPSPLFYQDRLYFVKDGGMLSSLDARTGTVFYQQERLQTTGSYYASPVAAAGRIYLASLPGKLTVVKAGGEKPEILHQADFGDRIFATPALAGDNIYVRTQKKLYAFGP